MITIHKKQLAAIALASAVIHTGVTTKGDIQLLILE